jgi:DNA-binding transcriptional MerR regulator
MLPIGDFSKLSRVPITTLRYYDDMGLLKPEAVDPQTHYRYYSASQLPRLTRILALKDLGFSLEQIAQVLDEGLSREELQGMFRLKRAEIQQQLEQDQERLFRIEARMRQIAMEETLPEYEVLVKDVEPQLVASIRDMVPNYQHIATLLTELYSYLQLHGAGGRAGSVLHDEEYKLRDVDVEGVAYLSGSMPESHRVKVYQLPAATMASVVHHGSFNTVNLAYEGIIRWMEANEYRIAGPIRELYLSCTTPLRQDDESYVTEIQLPIEKWQDSDSGTQPLLSLSCGWRVNSSMALRLSSSSLAFADTGPTTLSASESSSSVTSRYR